MLNGKAEVAAELVTRAASQADVTAVLARWARLAKVNGDVPTRLTHPPVE